MLKLKVQKEGVATMKYLTTLFWGFFLGHVVNYIGSSLTGGSYSFTTATVIGLLSAVLVMLIAAVVPKSTEDHKESYNH